MTESAPFGRGRLAARVLARVIRCAVWVGSRLPSPVAHGVAVVGGTMEWALRPAKRRTLAINLSHAVGSDPDSELVSRLVRQEIRNEAHRSADLLWALGKPQDFLAATRYEGLERARNLISEGQGFILASVHVGGWEVATSVPGQVFEVPTAVIVADDWLAWGIEHARVAAGLEVLYATNAPITAVRHLKAGGALLVLGDDHRFATRRRSVEFLGGSVRMAAGVATISRLAQVPVLTFDVLPIGPRAWRVTIDPPLQPPEPDSGEAGEDALLQALADRWSALISDNPEHWAAVHPIDWGERD